MGYDFLYSPTCQTILDSDHYNIMYHDYNHNERVGTLGIGLKMSGMKWKRRVKTEPEVGKRGEKEKSFWYNTN